MKNEMKKEVDYRIGQKVILTLKIEDKGQDFTELDMLENGVLLGNSPMFSHGRLSLLGIGSLDGMDYFTVKNIIEKPKRSLKGFYIYIKNTSDTKDPLPWNAKTLNYKIVGTTKVVKANRFIKKIICYITREI